MVFIFKHPFLFLFSLLLVPLSSASAMDCLDYSEYPHWISQLETPVWAQDVLVDGDLAYLSIRTAGVLIIDISDPNEPLQVGSVADWTGTACRLALSGSLLFISDGDGRSVHVVDVSDPTEPIELTQIATGIWPDGLAVVGSTLFVAVQYDGVAMFDISDLESIQPLGFLSVFLAHNVRVFGDRLYVTGFFGDLTIYDLSEPTEPDLLAQLSFDGEVETYDVAEMGNLTYVVGAFGGYIVDMVNPSAPAVVGYFATNGGTITIAGPRAYLNPYNLTVLDLSDPLNPVQAFGLPRPCQPGANPILKTVVSGGFAFCASRNAGLMVADLGHDEAPSPVWNSVLPTSAQKVRLWNDHALVANQTAGLLLMDLSDPENPELQSTVESENAHDVITEGSLAYLADGGDGLKIIDLSNPSAPLPIGHLDTYSRLAMGLDLNNETIYLAADLNGLMVIDVSDPSQPSLISQFETESRAQDVCFSGGYAYVADHEGGLQVVDVSNAAAPFVAAALSLPGFQKSVILDGSILFVGGMSTGLRAVDISIPTEPEILGWIPVEAHDLALDGKILLAAGEKGVSMIDRSDPTALKSVGFLPTGEMCRSVAIANGFLLAAGEQLSLASKDCRQISGVEDVPSGVSLGARLSGAPNPFNPRIEIEFELKQAQQVELEIFDLAGSWVCTLASGQYSAATHRLRWDGRNFQGRPVSAGCYFVLLNAEHSSQSMKVMLVR